MPTIVHFDIATDDPERAKEFYEGLFDWKMESPPGMTDYYLIETKDLNGEKVFVVDWESEENLAKGSLPILVLIQLRSIQPRSKSWEVS